MDFRKAQIAHTDENTADYRDAEYVGKEQFGPAYAEARQAYVVACVDYAYELIDHDEFDKVERVHSAMLSVVRAAIVATSVFNTVGA